MVPEWWVAIRIHSIHANIVAESLRANDGSGNELRPIAYDPLDVLDYLESGFIESRLDWWFVGEMATNSPSTMIPRVYNDLGDVIVSARGFLKHRFPDRREDDGEVASDGSVSDVRG